MAEGSKSRFSTEAVMSDVRQRAAQGYQHMEDVVGHNPASAVMVCFGIGVGLGLLVGLALAPEHEVSRRKTSYTDMAQRLGQQVLEAVTNVLPESLQSLRRS